MGKKPPTFEEALRQLETIAEQIEQGRIGLEESISKYEEGMNLIKLCRDILARAELKIQQLQMHEDGAVSVTPFQRERAPDKQDGRDEGAADQ
ncbi:MAG TPA: exodeoxyribonuclease VII small subunit [Phycisphaerae bacterium]|nr:exodeoxyribonuclease VII small subunit [Phycisphaerae bacterium]HNU45203.1 exodeoxyribonuclease VII small subunit [Phycisphaerae bacterium]